MDERIEVAVVDDHPLFREGVVHSLEAEPDIAVVGQGATADDAIRLAQRLLPDLMLLDLGMPGGGLNAAKSILAECPVVKIVVLTASAEEDDLLAALKAGARGYVVKGVASRELVSIIHTVQAGDVYVTPSVAAGLLVEMASTGSKPKPPANPLDELTERENQILALLAQGQSNKEIGQKLYLTEKTVKHYITNIFQKLQVRNRVEAALLAQRSAHAEPKR